MSRKENAILLSVTCLGISSIICQIVMVREFLNLFTGNELVLGLVLGNWLFLTGVGCYLGRFAGFIRRPHRLLFFLQVTMALLPLLLLFIIRLLKQHYVPGLMLSMQDAFLSSFLALAPYCLMSGFLLPFFAAIAGSGKDAVQIGRVYSLDVLGDIIGGLLFSFFLIYFFEPTEILLFLLFINLMAASLVSRFWLSRPYIFLAIFLGTASLLICSAINLEQITARLMFPGQDLVLHKTTPYGNLAITESNKQITVYENGVVSGSTQDPIQAEEIVHFGLAQHKDPKNILIISGGLSGSLAEALKYPIRSIDYVEIDAAVIDLVKARYHKADIAKIRFHAIDGRKFIRRVQNIYDVIIIDLPDPRNAQLNRYYTADFFKEVKEALHQNGVLGFSLSGSENYNNPESRLLSSSIYQSLDKIFDHILLVPGIRNIFLASSSPLTYDIAERISERGITTKFINKAYLTARLSEDRISQAKAMVSENAKVNEDFFPSSYFIQIRYWLSHFQESLFLPIIFIVILTCGISTLILKSNHRPAAAAVGTSGFVGMGLEIILLFSFQSFYGYVYQQLGIVFTSFLIGTALGVLWGMKSKADPRSLMVKLDLFLAFIALALPFLLIFIQQHALALESLAAWFLFPFMTLTIGFVVGAQFQAAARMMFSTIEDTAARLYSLDFLGSALGAFIVSAFAVPLLGIKSTCFVIGTMKLVTAVRLSTAKESGDYPLKTATLEPSTRNLAIVLGTLLALGALIASNRTGLHLYAISFAPVYHWSLLFLLAYGTLQAVARDNVFHLPGQSLFKQPKTISLGRMLTFLAFSLAVFFPIFRCYFKIPYLFCHVCPRQCVFGYLRPYLVPAALIMNIEKRHWCFNLCPIGTLHDCQSKKSKQRFSLPKSLAILPVVILIGTAASYSLVKIHAVHHEAHGIDWYNAFYKNIFAADRLVLLIAAALLLFAFFMKRPFCELLCPVGTFSKLVLKAEKIMAKNEPEPKREG